MNTFPVRRTLVGACILAALGSIPGTRANDADFAKVERGRYLAWAGDCAACHTDEGGRPFAGGRAVPTPFGTIYATNITPDKETGIGSWTDEQFWLAMHEGRRPDGEHLYPAFPYPWFTKMSRDDVLAIRAYIDTLKPVRQENRKPDLPWPLSWRRSVAGWNLLYFDDGTYKPNPSKSAQWNRGAYLVEGMGHCGACHSPKNFLGGVKKGDRFEGGMGEGWFATNLTGNPGGGLGAWSVGEIVEYLQTGANDRARAMGPMAEVVVNSTSHLSRDDLEAMATYLKDIPAAGPTPGPGIAANDARGRRGHEIYIDQCAGCHMEDGSGIAKVFPPMKGNSGVLASDPTSLARLVLEGAPSAKTPAKPEGFAMPGFAWKLDDQQVADLLTYVRGSFGNGAAPVDASKVADVRRKVTRKG